MAEPSINEVHAGGYSFTYESAGNGEPIVCLHGFPESAACWRPVTPLLTEAGFATYAPNQRGYAPGARPDAVQAYAIETLASDVLAMAAAWGLDTFHVIGHDWGAAVAWYLGAHFPDRLRTLTAVSLPHLAAYGWALAVDADQQRRAAYIGLLREPGKAEEVLLADDAARLSNMFGDAPDPVLRDEHVALLRQPGALTGALNWYRAMTAELRELPDVTVPTTYVWSDGDIAIGRAGAERCGAHVTADYRFVELSDVSHWIPEEAPETLAAVALERIGA